VDAILGTDGDDVLTGTPAPDFICGLGGNDRIDGGAGDDVIDGGAGDDDIDGGAGDDDIDGGAGNDEIEGGDGSDCLLGGAGDDRIDGGPGDDALDGQDGENVLVGGPGLDAAAAPLDDQEPGDVPLPVLVTCTPGDEDHGVAPTAGNPFADPVGQLKKAAGKVLALAVPEEAEAAPPPPPPPLLAVFPLERPLALVGGHALVRVTCSGAFLTSKGELTLETLPRREDGRTRAVGDSTRFACSPQDDSPVVRFRLRAAEQRRIERLGRLRVRATAVVENAMEQSAVARSFFTLVPARP